MAGVQPLPAGFQAWSSFPIPLSGRVRPRCLHRSALRYRRCPTHCTPEA